MTASAKTMLGGWLSQGGRRAYPALFAVGAFLAVLAVEQAIEYFARRAEAEAERIDVLNVLSTARARLEGVINANVLAAHGMAAVIGARPGIEQAEFSRIAQALVEGHHALRNIVAAPDLVATLVHPIEGNEAVIGLDYRNHPGQRPSVLRVKETGKPLVAGPLPLVQGGTGVIVREPVFVPAGVQARVPGERPRFWGIVSVVMDAEELYRHGGLHEIDASVRIALRGTDGTGADGPVFFGAAAVFEGEPVTRDIALPGGSWRIAAVPAAGWGQGSETRSLIRLLGLLAAIAAAVLAYLLARAGLGLASEIGERKRAEEGLRRLNRVYVLQSGINEAIVRQRDPRAFFEEACRIAVERAEFRMAWLGMADPGSGEVAPLAQAGNGEEYLKDIHVSLGDDEHGRGPTAMALKEGRHVVCNDIANDPRMAPWREAALALGYRASAAFPIRVGGQIRGIFSLYADRPGFFDTAELRLLDELALNIGFALDYIEADRAREASNRRYQSLLEMAPFPAVISRVRDGILVYGNHRAEVQYGIKREEGIGQQASRFYQDASHRERLVEQLRKTGRADDVEVPMLTRDGRPFWALVSASIVEFENEPAIYAAINDITERRRMEDEIRQLNADLEERVARRTAELAAVNKELETFTYSVSHDLKAPLRGIDGYSRLLMEEHWQQLDEEGRLFLRNVCDGVEKMTELIEDLLAYSRMERRELQGTSVDLAREVEAVVAERRAEIEAMGVQLEVDVSATTVQAHPEGLAMVLRNLIDNALKFSRDSRPPSLKICATAGEKSAILSVRDNGIGFDMKFHDRIFDIFQRLQRVEDYPGTGIGLAIVRKAMQRMGGRVWAESAPGQGATFFVELPR